MTNKSAFRGGPISALRSFMASEGGGGIALILAAGAALIMANSAWGEAYHHLIDHQIGPAIAPRIGPTTLHLIVNDLLMAVFFLLVGLEIKREFVDGRLATWERRRLPAIAAASGMAVPALIYVAVAGAAPPLANGWAIPAATDIAFALAVLGLLGKRAPTSLKLFLTTVAIVDDLGAVAIIAVAYTASLNTLAIGIAAALMLMMYAMGKSGVVRLWPYLILAALLWYAILFSGIHATVAGVLAAMCIPIVKTPGAPDSEISPLHRLEHAIAPWSAFLIVPLFGFVNAGLSLEGLTLDMLLAPLPLGVALGLFLGKQIGIFGAIWIAVRTGFGERLRGVTWLQVYGVCLLCGIGFTMSLFIGSLAFPDDPALVDEAKLGVLVGSLLSALMGYAVLRFAPFHPRHEEVEREQSAEIDCDGDVDCLEERPR